MNNRQDRVTAAAKRASNYALHLEHAPVRVTEAAKRLEEALERALEARQKQSSAKNSRKAPRYSVNRAKTILLRKHLDPITTDGLDMLAGLPGIADSLKLPRIKDAPEKHLEAAKRVRRVAEDHEEEFINQYNYEKNFLESFDEAVRTLDAAARVERGSARARYSRATADMKEAIARVRRVFDALDARMREAYLDDREKLKLWRTFSRVPAKTGRPTKRQSIVRQRKRMKLQESRPETPQSAT
jgi:exonuclease VII large subunit